jgi:alpha-ketoglutarate-dependent taurine dioxygenase
MTQIEVVPLTGRIGAELRGVRLTPDLDPDTAEAVHAAWLRHKVVFFRDQAHLDDVAQEGLAQIFGGASMPHPTVPAAQGTAFIYELDSRLGSASYWHTDLSWARALPRGSILRAVVVPPFGGDTLWANTATAYQDLPPRLRSVVDHGWALHSNGSGDDMDSSGPGDGTAEKTTEKSTEKAFWSAFRSTVFETWHPLVHVHPETRERCLLLGRFLRQISGLSLRRSASLHATLESYVTRPENSVRWHWRAGDVAVWDNRATQHYATADYGTARRIMHRVSIDGEPTVSLYGRPSRTTQRDSASQQQGRRQAGALAR